MSTAIAGEPAAGASQRWFLVSSLESCYPSHAHGHFMYQSRWSRFNLQSLGRHVMHIRAAAAASVVSARIHFLFDSIFHREELKVTG